MHGFKFEMKMMGSQLYVPVFVFLLMIILISAIPISSNIAYIMTQIIFIPFSSWWIVNLVYDQYHTNSEEILTQIFSIKPFIFLNNYIKFTIFYLCLTLFICISLSLKFEDLNFVVILTIFISQVLLISSCSLFVAVYFKSIEIAFMLIIIYAGTEGVTMGELIPWYHIFFFQKLSLGEALINGIEYLFISSIFLIMTYKNIKTLERRVL